MEFSNTLAHWYLQNKRDLPWRNTNDPYLVWLSEIILQQTRVDQGLPYYLKFQEAFPTVFDLAAAPLEKVLKLWQGLGYYSRARNLHETAIYISTELNGEFPDSFEGLLKLKGVGEYTASAIASICYEEPVAVVDGNVYRILARYFGIETPINSTAGIKEFRNLALEMLDRENPARHNQAVMEFGSQQCKPQLPMCHQCPLSGGCLALKNSAVNVLPVKLKKTKVKKRYFNYLVFLSSNNTTLLEKRIGKGIWEGLYQFPLIETNRIQKNSDFIKGVNLPEIQHKKIDISLYNETPVVHKLSHQHIYTFFWLIEQEEEIPQGVAVENLNDYPVPVLIANFLNDFDFPQY